jgi:hypothetical protein
MFRTLLAAAICAVLWPASAHALSCAPPSVDRTSVDAAAAVFEGVVTAEKQMPPNDKGIQHSSFYTFQVTKNWKGLSEGDVVTVSRHTMWGEHFQMGQAYLVFADSRDDQGHFVSGPCGLTTAMEYAEPLREMLQKVQDGADGPQPQHPQAPTE